LRDTPKNIIESKLPCADVLYHDLVKDPLQTVKNVYKQFGWEVSAEYETIIKDYLEVRSIPLVGRILFYYNSWDN